MGVLEWYPPRLWIRNVFPAGLLDALSAALQAVLDALYLALESSRSLAQFDCFLGILGTRQVDLPPQFYCGCQQFLQGSLRLSNFVDRTFHLQS